MEDGAKVWGGVRLRRRQDSRSVARDRFVRALIGLFGVLAAGTVLLHVVDRAPWTEAIYDAILIATTIGASFHPQGPTQYLLVAAVAITEVALGFYALSTLTGLLVEGDIQQVWGRRRMDRRIAAFEGHLVIAGGGRVGREAATEAQRAKSQVVVIDSDRRRVEELIDASFLVIPGDATDPDTLKAAGMERARGIICCLPKDAENLYVVLATRELNPAAEITARAEELQSERRLLQAGAQRVVFPSRIGGRRLARLAIQPASYELVDSSWLWQRGLDLMELDILEHSALAGLSIREVRGDMTFLVVALGRGGDVTVTPPPDMVVTPGDRLVLTGERSELERLMRAAGGQESTATTEEANGS